MKLIRIVDAYDKTHYFNPKRVAQVEEVGSDRCVIRLSDEMTIGVKRSVHEVYGLIMSETSED